MKSSQPDSLFDVWCLHKAEVQNKQALEQASSTLSLVKTALIRYTLPAWGLDLAQHSRLTAWQTYLGLNLMKQTDLKQFSRALQAQQQVFEQLETPQNIQRTYRSALRRLLKWCEMQPWWKPYREVDNRYSALKQGDRAIKRAPKHATSDCKRTKQNRKHPGQARRLKYGLGAVGGDVVPASLQAELDAFCEFRQQQGVKQSTIAKDLRQIRLILGWLYRIKQIPLEELSLQRLVRSVDLDLPELKDRSTADAAAFEALDLAKQHIDWLKATHIDQQDKQDFKGLSPYSSLDVFRIFLIVAQFNYRFRLKLIESSTIQRYQDVPVVQIFRQEVAHAQSEVRKQRSTGKDSSVIPEWSEYLGFIEQLRQACVVDVIHGFPARKAESSPSFQPALAAAAQNYQCFLLAALLCYLPPQRQQVYRNLLIGRSPTEKQEFDAYGNPEISGFIYQEQKQWHLKLLNDNYKTSKTYSEVQVKIPNIQYRGNRCFYQYLEEWLFSFKYKTSKGKVEVIDGLRRVFDPQHDYFFTQRNGKLYSHATNFSKLLQTANSEAFSVSFTPELIRKMFCNRILEQEAFKEKFKNLLTRTENSKFFLGSTYDTWITQETVQLGSEFARQEVQNFLKK